MNAPLSCQGSFCQPKLFGLNFTPLPKIIDAVIKMTALPKINHIFPVIQTQPLWTKSNSTKFLDSVITEFYWKNPQSPKCLINHFTKTQNTRIIGSTTFLPLLSGQSTTIVYLLQYIQMDRA